MTVITERVTSCTVTHYTGVSSGHSNKACTDTGVSSGHSHKACTDLSLFSRHFTWNV